MSAMRAIDLERTYTSDEFENLPQFDKRYELLDGRLVEKPLPGLEHQLFVRRLIQHYDRFDPEEKLGMMIQEVNVRLSPGYTPMPDVSFWVASRRPKITKKAAPRPDLAVEIWSPGDLDTRQHRQETQAKIQEYLSAGVSLVWAINPARRQVEVYRLAAPETVLRAEAEAELEGENVMPGFRLKLARLFD